MSLNPIVPSPMPLQCYGDILLLVSDGAWTPLIPYLIKKSVMGNIGKHFSELPAAVLDVAGRMGRADDMTAVVIRIVR